eukprot:1160317-Pelagomonas_calceolata.AAC.8
MQVQFPFLSFSPLHPFPDNFSFPSLPFSDQASHAPACRDASAQPPLPALPGPTGRCLCSGTPCYAATEPRAAPACAAPAWLPAWRHPCWRLQRGLCCRAALPVRQSAWACMWHVA